MHGRAMGTSQINGGLFCRLSVEPNTILKQLAYCNRIMLTQGVNRSKDKGREVF